MPTKTASNGHGDGVRFTVCSRRWLKERWNWSWTRSRSVFSRSGSSGAGRLPGRVLCDSSRGVGRRHAAARGGLEGDPARAGEEQFRPRVRVAGTDGELVQRGPVAAGNAVAGGASRGVPGDDAAGNAQRARHHGHGRSKVHAIAGLFLEECLDDLHAAAVVAVLDGGLFGIREGPRTQVLLDGGRLFKGRLVLGSGNGLRRRRKQGFGSVVRHARVHRVDPAEETVLVCAGPFDEVIGRDLRDLVQRRVVLGRHRLVAPASMVPVSGLQRQLPGSPLTITGLPGIGNHTPRYLSVTTRVTESLVTLYVAGISGVASGSVTGTRSSASSGCHLLPSRFPITEVRRYRGSVSLV